MSFPLRRLARRIALTSRERDILHTAQAELIPPDSRPDGGFVPDRMNGHAGIDLAESEQLAWLQAVAASDLGELFAILRDDPEINPGHDGRSFVEAGAIHNGFYPTPDAEVYAAMIAREAPAQIIEVGSGYSTVIARRTVTERSLSASIRVIDPQPRRDVAAVVDEIEYARVEESTLAATAIDSNTLLFIDSSHVCRSGGDLPYLFTQLLPSLPAGVLVHVHDIFLPYDYPDGYHDRFYTEQYLLHALLAGSRSRVKLATHYLARTHPEAMRAAFGSAVASDPLLNGASFWFTTGG